MIAKLDHIWRLDLTFTHLLALLLVGAIAGPIGEHLVGRGMLRVVLASELSLAGIPVLSAIPGAAIVVLLFSLVAGGGFARGWRRS